MPKPHRFVLQDFSNGIAGATQTIYADSPQPAIVWDDSMLAAQTGPIPYTQSSQAFIHGEGGYKFEMGIHVFELPASCNDEANEPVYQTLIAMAPKDRWSGYPLMVGYDAAVDSTIPKPFRITAYNEDNSIHHIFEMYRDQLPINHDSLGQTRNLTTRWRPFVNTAQMLYYCSARLKMSSDARKYYSGTRAQYWHRPTLSKQRPFSNAAIPVFGTLNQQPNGYVHFLMMPEWSANTSDADWNADPKTDPTVPWGTGNGPDGPSGADKGSQYPTGATGWRYEPGAYNAGHEPRRGPGGSRFDRFPAPSQLAYLMTEPDGARMQGNVSWRTLWDNYAAGFFNLPYHQFTNARTLGTLPFATVSSGQIGHNHAYYFPGSLNPSDPSKWVDLFGLPNGSGWSDFNYDRDGRLKYSAFTTDSQHMYFVPAWHTTHFNSVAHAISQKLCYYATIMAWNKYYSEPTASMAGNANNDEAMIFQRQHAWRWEQMAFLWKTAGSGPLVPRADVEALWKVHLESMHDQVVVPTKDPAHAHYNRPLFAGLRNLGLPARRVVSGTDHYLKAIDDDKKFYFFGVLTVMRTLGCFDRLRQLSAKCAAALDFVVECYGKAGPARMVATKGRTDYGYCPLTPTVPTTTPLTMPADWAAVAAAMQPQDNSDMVRKADGTAYRGNLADNSGNSDNYGNRERWLYQHLLQQTCYVLKDHFADYAIAQVNEAAAMSDDFEQFALADIQAGNQEWGQRFIAAGPMLADSSSAGEQPVPQPTPATMISGPYASSPFGAPYLLEEAVPTVTSVTVSPAAATGNATFTAAVVGANSPSQVVTWSASAGSITSGGVFTAPTPTNSVQTITITATSVQDASKSGTATVTIAALVPTVTGVIVNPASANGSAMFSATVIGANNPSQEVTWSISPSLGSITQDGQYTAPDASEVEQVITVRATSTFDTAMYGQATVTIAALPIDPEEPQPEGTASVQRIKSKKFDTRRMR